jgi:hypothetical protein
MKTKTPQNNVSIKKNTTTQCRNGNKNTTRQCKNKENTTKQCKNKEKHHNTM